MSEDGTVTAADVLRILPTDGFVRQYIEYGRDLTDAPLAFHLGAAIVALAAAAPPALRIYYNGRYIPANVYAILSSPGGDREAPAVQLCRDIMECAIADTIGDRPGSWEGLVEHLRERPKQVITWTRFDELLIGATRNPRLLPIKTTLRCLYDGETVERQLVSRTTRAESPNLSLLAGANLSYLERYTQPEDWLGGLFPVCLTFYAERETTVPLDPISAMRDPNQREAIVAMLTERRRVIGGYLLGLANATVGACLGIHPDAIPAWEAWYNRIDSHAIRDAARDGHLDGNRLRSYASAAPMIALRIALLFGFDRGWARSGERWMLTLAELEPAMAIVDLHLKSARGLQMAMADTPFARDRRAVYEAVPRGGAWASLGSIEDRCAIRKKALLEILEGLVDAKRLESTLQGSGAAYRRTMTNALAVEAITSLTGGSPGPVGPNGPAPAPLFTYPVSIPNPQGGVPTERVDEQAWHAQGNYRIDPDSQ